MSGHPGGLRRSIFLIVIVAAFALSARVARAQSSSIQNTTVNVNYVYAASLGFGGYSLAGLSANVYTLPLSDTLVDIPRPGWSLRLLLPVQLGIYDFRGSYAGNAISVNQQSISLVPGAELQIPLTDRFVVKPFGQFGAAHSFGTHGDNPDAWIYLGGVRSVAQWQAGGYTISLGNGIVYAGDNAIGPGFGEHYVSLQAAVEVRHSLGFQIGSWTPDLGVYLAEYYYPAPLTFSRFLQSPLKVNNQNEIGFSVGTVEPMKILWLSKPRLGAGIVFGGGLNVYHVTFGFPF